jgi:hypothetical protein
MKNEAAAKDKDSIQSQGGKARAESLTATDRKAIARRAAETRWGKAGKLRPIPKATHEGILIIGDIEIPCAVLEDGTAIVDSERSYDRPWAVSTSQGKAIL